MTEIPKNAQNVNIENEAKDTAVCDKNTAVDGAINQSPKEETMVSTSIDNRIATTGIGSAEDAKNSNESEKVNDKEPDAVANEETTASNVDKASENSTDKDDDKIIDKDEDVCFESRARLYRYNTQKSSWKERGTGQVQIMRHKNDGKIRIVMRRDQTFIICCNHFITEDMYLKPLPTSKNTFTWCTAADHYDGETNPEVLAIKLPKDNLDRFEEVFNYAVKNNQNALKQSIQHMKDKKSEDSN